MFDTLLLNALAEGVRQIPETLHVMWGFVLANPWFSGLMFAVLVMGGLTNERRVPARHR